MEATDLDFDFMSPAEPSKCLWHARHKMVNPHASVVKTKDHIQDNVLSCIGDTPLVRLNRIPKEYGLDCEVLVKCEFMNPGGSVKDRIALRMIEDAEKQGLISPGGTLIEPTSGNTGIGLALAAAVKGYRCIIVMPQKMSLEKENVVRALGAQVVRTPTAAAFDAPNSNFSVAQRLSQRIPNAFVLDQFRNPGNPLAHYDHTAEEIIQGCQGRLDMVVMGAGTGGTVTGIGRKIKEKIANCRVITVDPEESTLAPQSEGNIGGFYEVEGIGYDFCPMVLDKDVVDEWIKVGDKESFFMARQLIMKEGLLCGGSSGSAVVGAIDAAKKAGLKKGHRVVVILADGVRNYMTKFLSDQWMEDRGFPIPIEEKINLVSGSELLSSTNSLSKGLEGDPWYFDISVSKITEGMDLITVMENTKITEAIAIMRREGYDQLPVVSSEGSSHLLGMVTVDDLMAKIASGSVKGSSPVLNCLTKGYPKMSQEATIRSLSQMLKSSHFVVITESGVDDCNEKIVGILTHIDIINFLIEMEQNES